MGKLKNNQEGFSAVEVVLVVVVVALIGIVGWLIYKNQHKTARTSTATSSTTKPAPTANPYAGWKSYCDSMSKTCLHYPSNWTEQAGLGNQGAVITSPDSTISLYENPNPGNCANSQPGEINRFYVNSVDKVTSSSLSLEVVGGYFYNQLNGSPRYNPYYILTSTDNVNKYNLKVGSTVNFPDAWTCYNYGVISGGASSQPAGSNEYNSTTQAASSWFSTSDAKTSLKILQSVYTD